MITLTTPHSVISVLGGTSTVAYGKMVLSPLDLDPINQTVRATVYITSTTSPDMQAITGELLINIPTAKLEIQVRQLDFYRRITLTSPQTTSILNMIQSAQNSVEQGMISVGVISGTQTTGA